MYDMCYLYGWVMKVVSICFLVFYVDLVCDWVWIYKYEFFDDFSIIVFGV